MDERQHRYVEDTRVGTGQVFWFPPSAILPDGRTVSSRDFREWCRARKIRLNPISKRQRGFLKAYLFTIKGADTLMEFRIRWE